MHPYIVDCLDDLLISEASETRHLKSSLAFISKQCYFNLDIRQKITNGQRLKKAGNAKWNKKKGLLSCPIISGSWGQGHFPDDAPEKPFSLKGDLSSRKPGLVPCFPTSVDGTTANHLCKLSL